MSSEDIMPCLCARRICSSPIHPSAWKGKFRSPFSRSGCPDTDVHTSRFEDHNRQLIPLGRREAVYRLQRRVWCLEGP